MKKSVRDRTASEGRLRRASLFPIGLSLEVFRLSADEHHFSCMGRPAVGADAASSGRVQAGVSRPPVRGLDGSPDVTSGRSQPPPLASSLYSNPLTLGLPGPEGKRERHGRDLPPS